MESSGTWRYACYYWRAYQPTGKSKFKQALKEHNLDYILKEGITQQDKGAHILDVNVGLPDIDEVVMMKEVVRRTSKCDNLPPSD